jgi:hypothetical protein
MFPAAVIDSNPGIYTVQDYINFVEGKGKKKKAIGFLVLLAIGAAAAIGIHLSGKNSNVRL